MQHSKMFVNFRWKGPGGSTNTMQSMSFEGKLQEVKYGEKLGEGTRAVFQ